ncbi:Diaminopimelate epimerase-like protein [Jackrogersella minutella]|nr:Diaminopimelate epimerase-like protein [Jackrogersella minutella]
MALTFTTFDVFTSTPFRGNPLAIVEIPTGTELSQDQKQLIAREFNLSETVFLHEQTPADVQKQTVRIDIFTALSEVAFAGHPTIGTANFLLFHRHASDARFLATKAGLVQFTTHEAGAELLVAHDVHVHDSPFAGTAFAQHPVVSIVNGMTAILARLPDLEALGRQTANLVGTENTYAAKEALDLGWRNGPVVSYFYVDLGGGGADGTRRLRARSMGSREDPATGSAASGLCSYLSLAEEGPRERAYEITQGVEVGRRGVIRVKVTLSEDGKTVQEVRLAGDAVKVLEGAVPVPGRGVTVAEE